MDHRRVILADSHLNMLGGVYSLLSSLFDSVMMVADEASLLDAIVKFNPDLVVVDLSLPNEGEASVAKRMLERDPALRVIVLSIHDEPFVVTQMQTAGVAGFVLKRSAAMDLIPAVTNVLAGGTYVSPAIGILNMQDRSAS